MWRLFPLPAVERPADSVYADLAWPPPPAARPHVALNMVSTVDGRAAVAGRAAGIGGAHDRLLMRQLRARADAVMVGVGTLRAEALTPTVPPSYVAARLARGQTPQPLGVLVSNSGRLPLARAYFARADFARVLITSAAGATTVEPAAAAGLRLIVAGETTVDLSAALAALRDELGVRWLLCEGGPTLNQALLRAGLVDELFLTLAPKLAGGSEPSIVASAPPLPDSPIGLRLLALHADGDELYLHYQVAPSLE
ncbi:MAG TPA: dihydrofolate reductase family protein [Chloroflexota bacterium]|nr:dihydrofolate reductase family protein [Chloroflexota bacterium]